MDNGFRGLATAQTSPSSPVTGEACTFLFLHTHKHRGTTQSEHGNTEKDATYTERKYRYFLQPIQVKNMERIQETKVCMPFPYHT